MIYASVDNTIVLFNFILFYFGHFNFRQYLLCIILF